MKIFIKTLKGTSFEVETNPDVTIADLKKKIETIQGAEVYPAEKQMLIHQGKVLKDPTTIGDNGVAENSFLVIMLSKAKPSSSGASSVSTTPATQAQAQTQSSTPAVPAPTPVTPQAQPASESVAVPAAAPPSFGEANVYGQAASNLVAGSNLETTIQQILEMGGGSWDRDTVLRALRAAFNNPERAIEYLYSGIPEQAGVPAVAPAPAAPPAGGQVVNPSPEVPPVPSSIPNASPLNLFPEGLPNVGANAGADGSAGAGASSLDFLRNSEQFQALRSMVQANPQILQPMLQELGKSNPHLMRLIQEHQNDFVRLINEPAEEGEGNLLSQLASTMPQTLSVTPEERDAIERLEAMGFRRGTVLQVFFACNKNEELAANYLLDHMDDLNNDDDDDGGLL